jgi:hypothetical protein
MSVISYSFTTMTSFDRNSITVRQIMFVLRHIHVLSAFALELLFLTPLVSLRNLTIGNTSHW